MTKPYDDAPYAEPSEESLRAIARPNPLKWDRIEIPCAPAMLYPVQARTTPLTTAGKLEFVTSLLNPVDDEGNALPALISKADALTLLDFPGLAAWCPSPGSEVKFDLRRDHSNLTSARSVMAQADIDMRREIAAQMYRPSTPEEIARMEEAARNYVPPPYDPSVDGDECDCCPCCCDCEDEE